MSNEYSKTPLHNVEQYLLSSHDKKKITGLNHVAKIQTFYLITYVQNTGI